MNREQAEHLLDANVLMGVQGTPKAKNALKEVILDAMTSTTYYPITIGCPTPSKPVTTPWTIPTWVGTTTSVDGPAQGVDA